MATPPTQSGTPRKGIWGPLALIGLLATASGIFLPQLLPDDPSPSPAPTQTKEKASKPGDLQYTPPELPEVPSTRSMFIRLGVTTVVVLLVGVTLLWCGQAWLRRLNPGPTPGGKLALLETLQLGNRCCLHLVQTASGQIVVGADASGIKSILPVTESFENALTEREEPTPRLAGAA